MEEQTDSRTAGFSLKRPHAEASHQELSGGSAASTPRKSRKSGWSFEKRNTQRLGNVLPPSDNPGSTVASASIEHDHQELREAPQGIEPTPNNHGAPTLSPVNWNTGSKPKIRVSLRRPPNELATASLQEQSQPTAENYNGSQADVGSGNKDTGITYHADTADALAESRRLVPDNLSWSTTKSDNQELFKGYSFCNVRLPPKSAGSDVGRATLDFASPSSVPRAIEQFHNGSVRGSNASIQLAPMTGRDDKNPVSESKEGRMQSQEIGLGRGRASGKESTSGEDPNGVAIQLDPSPSNARSATLPQEPRLSGDLEDGREFSFRLNHLEGKPIKEETSCPQDEREVIINVLDDSDHESGQVTTSGESRIDTDYARENASNNNPDEQNQDHTSDIEEGDSGLTDEDAMIEYANSNAWYDGSSDPYVPSTTRTTLVKPQVLADLDQEEFELQIRYFYVGKARKDVALSEPIRCLLCTGTAHVAAQCDQLVCSRCGEQNAHSSKICPSMTVCAQCKEPGHIGSDCLSKVKKPHEVAICELCERQGHVFHDCELRWRTSGRPWTSNLEDRRIRFRCYECGAAGHLGNDCPSRRPNKPKGSSSWTYFRGARKAPNPDQGISIKGRAQQNPITIDDSDDPEENFRRPKIGAPNRPGNICIFTRGGQQVGDRQPLSLDTSRKRDGNLRDIGRSTGLISTATEIGHEKAQSVIDSITSSYAAEGQAGANPMLNPQGPPPQGFPPPPFGFPGGMPPPPFNMPPTPQGGFPPPPAGRGMPFPPFMPPAGSPANGAPPFPIPGPNGMPNMPFPPPNGMPPPNFAGGFPPPQGGPSPGPPMGGFGGPPPGGRFEGDPRSR
ncbi:MAG: hypothetical protein Q9212_005686 [Teloschistes hypoglaucus]